MKRHCITIILCITTLISCSKNEEKWIAFIGDSEIARWDLQTYFPTRLTENMGVSGSGLLYIKSLAGNMQGKDAVVLFGTNDLAWAYEGNIDEYVSQYITAVKKLAAQRTFVISIFPRCFKGDAEDINRKIESLNEKIKLSATTQDLIYINVFPLMLKDGTLNMQYSYDGLHLNDLGYELVSYELNKYIE